MTNLWLERVQQVRDARAEEFEVSDHDAVALLDMGTIIANQMLIPRLGALAIEYLHEDDILNHIESFLGKINHKLNLENPRHYALVELVKQLICEADVEIGTAEDYGDLNEQWLSCDPGNSFNVLVDGFQYCVILDEATPTQNQASVTIEVLQLPDTEDEGTLVCRENIVIGLGRLTFAGVVLFEVTSIEKGAIKVKLPDINEI